MTIPNLSDFTALDPFFDVITTGLGDLADGEHFFDLLADDVVFEYVITIPGYPSCVQGRDNIAALYRPYGNAIVLDSCHQVARHHDQDTGVVVLEYSSAGNSLITHKPYRNDYISVITITERKITHWRDYLNPLPALEALGIGVDDKR
jgi:ketosteroid isomerase-like protein